MTGRMSPHYGFRVAQSMIPCVEITERTWIQVPGGAAQATQVVKMKFGLTQSHAISRALKWMRKHGDPR